MPEFLIFMLVRLTRSGLAVWPMDGGLDSHESRRSGMAGARRAPFQTLAFPLAF
ncbi:hypothetical protein [Burkholderia glumae]|uniref:hypothetical protein n=1 Tax=Burkholderia glumae TaxID=337 RepID=UPI0012D354DC|nr:hypothetical protein [Burkholderia glumae]